MKRLVTTLALAASLALPVAAQTRSQPRESLTKAQFDELFHKLSNWGRWGKDDQKGTLNLITPAKRQQAARLVTAGISVSLARDLNAAKEVDNPDPFQHAMALGADGKFNTDAYKVNFHGFGFSHFDALSHTFYDGKLYNGFSESAITPHGGEVLDATQYRDGIFTRGVLIDIPWLRGLPYLDKTDHISAADLDLWERKTGVHVTSGDAVLIRTGRWALRNAKGPWDISSAAAGLDPSAVAWLHKRDAAFLVSDAAHDAIPSAVQGIDYPVHILTIVAMGMSLADQCNLEDVAATSVKLHRQTFLLTLAPIRIKGGTGALINPVATF
jgi:kynurenine formamidase